MPTKIARPSGLLALASGNREYTGTLLDKLRSHFGREVQRELFHLTQDEGIALDRIVMLTPRREKSHWLEGQKLGNFSLTWQDRRDEKKQILCATIHAFKGMESDVVLLTEMAKVHEKQRPQIWYTGLSRARHQVVIFETVEPASEGQL